ncbi:DUF2470 domain-containing protein [Streptomyces tagetis]|uniref:DUF2470 domain-containing protein n=1 Tax=Streptomyces tagetis TaxID=2820809 RepID=A0A940XIM7_9ACTN|nr:DUF2470 domain-containing protein [Streptomyces sp. RG38]MBQ0825275.1 DUF2470 domain-containing protein [Streptomyces sp. RG38]
MRRSRTQVPTAAERVHSILAAAHSMTVVSGGRSAEVHRLGGAAAMSRFHLHAPCEEAVTQPSGIPVRLDLTDVAPTPVRDRLRARVTLTGVLADPYDPGAADHTCMQFGQSVLEDATGRTLVTFEELEATELDPLALSEAALLNHLVDDHGELVPLLLRLVRPLPETGVLRALPVAIDRYGLTLRLEYRHGHRDARLPFKTPVTHPEHTGQQVQALLAAARRLSRTGRPL